jgi:iron complex transport system ATP-binding protein
MNTDHATPLLQLDSVQFGYERGEPVIRNLTAALRPGQLCVVLGPNAAGKSTLLRLILGLHQPWTGSVRLAGQEVAAMSPLLRARWMSYVPQRTTVEFAFTVEQVVAMGRFASERDPAAVERAIQTCDLEAIRRRPFNHLSTGQQQRVLVARALTQAAGGGRIMVLDEPGSAMDLRHVHHLMRLLRGLAQGGLAVLVVLHDLNVAVRYADVVWLLRGGEMAASGPWQQVMTPAMLEPIYNVELSALPDPRGDRPVFSVHEAAGL